MIRFPPIGSPQTRELASAEPIRFAVVVALVFYGIYALTTDIAAAIDLGFFSKSDPWGMLVVSMGFGAFMTRLIRHRRPEKNTPDSA